MLAAIAGEEYDKVPVGPFVGHRAAEETGISIRDYYTNGNSIAEAQQALRCKIGYDIMVSAADTYYISEAYGMETTHHEHALPTVKRPLFKRLKDSRRLTVPNPESDGRMPVYLAAVERMRSLAGENAAVRGTGTGPFSLSAYLFGEAEFLTQLIDIDQGNCSSEDESSYHNLMEVTSDTTIAFLKAQIHRGVDIIYMGDSFASSDMISPDFYRRYVFQYHRKVISEITPLCQDYGAYTLLHICGDNRAIFPDFAATGVNMIEIDQKVPLSEARAIVGNNICLIGNLDPASDLLYGTQEHVYDTAMNAMNDMRNEKSMCGRYILGSGCFVSQGTPDANLAAMVEAAKDFTNA